MAAEPGLNQVTATQTLVAAKEIDKAISALKSCVVAGEVEFNALTEPVQGIVQYHFRKIQSVNIEGQTFHYLLAKQRLDALTDLKSAKGSQAITEREMKEKLGLTGLELKNYTEKIEQLNDFRAGTPSTGKSNLLAQGFDAFMSTDILSSDKELSAVGLGMAIVGELMPLAKFRKLKALLKAAKQESELLTLIARGSKELGLKLTTEFGARIDSAFEVVGSTLNLVDAGSKRFFRQGSYDVFDSLGSVGAELKVESQGALAKALGVVPTRKRTFMTRNPDEIRDAARMILTEASDPTRVVKVKIGDMEGQFKYYANPQTGKVELVETWRNSAKPDFQVVASARTEFRDIIYHTNSVPPPFMNQTREISITLDQALSNLGLGRQRPSPRPKPNIGPLDETLTSPPPSIVGKVLDMAESLGKFFNKRGVEVVDSAMQTSRNARGLDVLPDGRVVYQYVAKDTSGNITSQGLVAIAIDRTGSAQRTVEKLADGFFSGRPFGEEIQFTSGINSYGTRHNAGKVKKR